MKWRQRIELEPELSHIESWPHIDIYNLSKEKRKSFIYNRAIIAQVLKGGLTLEDVAVRNGTTKSKVSKLLDRCLGGDQEDPPSLTLGLIPYYRVNKGKRRSQLPSALSNTGNSYAFQEVLDKNPDIKKLLDDAILAEVSDSKYKQNLEPKWLHALFIDALERNDWPQTVYPFNTVSLAYESIRQYYQKKRDQFLLRKSSMHHPKRIVSSKDMKCALFEEIQTDEQKYDLFSSACIDLDGLLEPISLSRVSLVLSRDVGTSAMLGYTLALTASPTRDDVINCIQSIRKEWMPFELITPGLEYAPEAGFPSGVYPETMNLCFGEIKLDNAFCHIARVVKRFITSKEFATFNLGIPASPRSRNWIEHAFKIANYHSHRFESTTGSNVLDPNRQSTKNAKKPPLISLRTLEECLDVALASYNAKPQGNLGGNSPLDLIRFQLQTVYLPAFPTYFLEKSHRLEQTHIVTVRWDKWSRTRPHVNFMKVKYKGENLCEELVNTKIKVRFNRDDIRELKAYTMTGESLGILTCSKSWRRFAHSMKTRKLINAHVKEFSLSARDPFTGYFTYLIENKKRPSTALELVRVYRECLPDRTTFKPNNIQADRPQSLQEEPLDTNDTTRQDDTLKDVDDTTFPEWDPDV